MTQKINKIREKCIEANKEIIELKFGCEVYFNDKTFGEPEHWGKICEWSGNPAPLNGFKVWTGLNRYVDIQKEDIAKIIGRPITLEDILQVILPEVKDTRSQLKYNRILQSIVNLWLLGKPLTDQSHVTINSIYEELNE